MGHNGDFLTKKHKKPLLAQHLPQGTKQRCLYRFYDVGFAISRLFQCFFILFMSLCFEGNGKCPNFALANRPQRHAKRQSNADTRCDGPFVYRLGREIFIL